MVIKNRCFTFFATLFVAGAAFAGDAPEASLYERLGGWDNIERIVERTIDRHVANPTIAHYFADVDREALALHVTAFFAAGTGGPAKYTGRDMTSAHADMGLTDAAFDSAVADVLAASRESDIDEIEVGEVAAILESLRPAVMGAAAVTAAN